MHQKNSAEKKNTAKNRGSTDIPKPSPDDQGPEISKKSQNFKPISDDITDNKERLEKSEGERPAIGSPTSVSITDNEARTWAMLAHFSVLLNLITGFLGGIAAIIIYFMYKDRSRLVAYHAMQSFIFQSITWLGAGIIAGILISIGTALSFLIIPLLCLVPGFLVLLLIPVSLIYGIVGGVQVNNGEDFRYWQVGDWVRNILEPEPRP